MHIAIEGLDGVGKTETARLVAGRLGFHFVEKPMHYLTDTDLIGMPNYLRMMKQINEELDQDFRVLYYGAGHCYVARYLAAKNDIVTDRHLCSTWYWNKTPSTLPVFDYLTQVCGLPDLTVILHASREVREARIKRRNPDDPDLRTKICRNDGARKMMEFVERYGANYVFIDTSTIGLNDVVDKIVALTKHELEEKR